MLAQLAALATALAHVGPCTHTRSASPISVQPRASIKSMDAGKSVERAAEPVAIATLEPAICPPLPAAPPAFPCSSRVASLSASATSFVRARAPGLGLAYLLSAAASRLADATALSPLLWASVLGIAVGSALRAQSGNGDPLQTERGVSFAKSRLLRLGIILYGVKLSVQQLAGVGLAGVLTDVFAVVSTMVLGVSVGAVL